MQYCGIFLCIIIALWQLFWLNVVFPECDNNRSVRISDVGNRQPDCLQSITKGKNEPTTIWMLVMQNGDNIDSGTVVTQQDVLPGQKQVVSKAKLKRIFGAKPPPFSLNVDGSVDLDVYQMWLNAVGQEALTALAQGSEVVSAKVDSVSDA